MRIAITTSFILLLVLVLIGAMIEADFLNRELRGLRPSAPTQLLIDMFEKYILVVVVFALTVISFNMILLAKTATGSRTDPTGAASLYNTWMLLQIILLLSLMVVFIVLFRYGYGALSHAPAILGSSPDFPVKTSLRNLRFI